MRVALITGREQVEFTDFPLPQEAVPSTVVVEVGRCGVCGPLPTPPCSPPCPSDWPRPRRGRALGGTDRLSGCRRTPARR
jgi:hypothetical protein